MLGLGGSSLTEVGHSLALMSLGTTLRETGLGRTKHQITHDDLG